MPSAHEAPATARAPRGSSICFKNICHALHYAHPVKSCQTLFSAIMMMAALVLPDTRSGMIEPSTHAAFQPANPQALIDHRKRSLPIRHVEVGW